MNSIANIIEYYHTDFYNYYCSWEVYNIIVLTKILHFVVWLTFTGLHIFSKTLVIRCHCHDARWDFRAIASQISLSKYPQIWFLIFDGTEIMNSFFARRNGKCNLRSYFTRVVEVLEFRFSAIWTNLIGDDTQLHIANILTMIGSL